LDAAGPGKEGEGGETGVVGFLREGRGDGE